MRYEALIGSFLGETASRLKRVFDYARTTPCVLFFDEFDAVGKERGDVHETGEISASRRPCSCRSTICRATPWWSPPRTTPSPSTGRPGGGFLVRLALPPTRKDLAAYVARFAESLDEPLGRKPATIARRLGAVSYAEAEEFCRNVRRRAVLTMGEKTLEAIVAERLTFWRERLPASAGPACGGRSGSEVPCPKVRFST